MDRIVITYQDSEVYFKCPDKPKIISMRKLLEASCVTYLMTIKMVSFTLVVCLGQTSGLLCQDSRGSDAYQILKEKAPQEKRQRADGLRKFQLSENDFIKLNEKKPQKWTWRSPFLGCFEELMSREDVSPLDSLCLEKVNGIPNEIEVLLITDSTNKSRTKVRPSLLFYKVVNDNWSGFFAIYSGQIQGMLMSGDANIELVSTTTKSVGDSSTYYWRIVESLVDERPFYCGVQSVKAYSKMM